MMLNFGLNQVTMSAAPLGEFLRAAARLGCVGVELRNDLDRPLFDGMSPIEAGAMVRDNGLRLLGLSQIYPFNVWSDDSKEALQRLLEVAVAAGAETISLIPNNEPGLNGQAASADRLDIVLQKCLPLLKDAEIVGLVEPLGFGTASLRHKSELVAVIEALGARQHIKLVHDTFHHTLAGGGQFFAPATGMVHISGVVAEDIGFK